MGQESRVSSTFTSLTVGNLKIGGAGIRVLTNIEDGRTLHRCRPGSFVGVGKWDPREN